MSSELHPDLERLLEPRLEAQAELLRRRWSAVWFIVLALLAPVALYLMVQQGTALWRAGFVIILAMVVGQVVIHSIPAFKKPRLRETAREVESENSGLKGVLLTAIEQPGSRGASYLQRKVIETAVMHGAGTPWVGSTLPRQIRTAKVWGGVAKVAFFVLITYGFVKLQQPDAEVEQQKTSLSGKARETTTSTVTPGDAEVELGGRLIVEARFDGRIPGEASLVLVNSDGTERNRFAMNRTVDASIFGGVITDIASDGKYRVEFEGGKSETYRITTFEYPALVKVDATVTPPAWMEQPATEVKNSMNFSVPEGSRVDFRVAVNKPLAEAELYGEDKAIVPLVTSKANPLLLDGSLQPVKTQKYRVHLVDDRQRGNKQPPSITVRVLPNLAPKIEVVFPKRDLAVSPIQELPVEGKVWDDSGVQRAGAVFMLGGDSKEVVLCDGPTKGGKPREVKTLFDLEPLKARPRQLVSYYLWAEDKGANGQTRRSMSDMFFAEVRHYEDIFREMEAPPGAGGEEQKGQADELVNLQKQVVNATWRLVRDAAAGKKHEVMASDVDVVRESEQISQEKTTEAIERIEDEEMRSALRSAVKAMEKAVQQYAKVNESKLTKDLDPALGSAREALEYLYQAQSREHQVMRSQSTSSKGGQQSAEKQLMQLELKQQERKYEEESQAAEESTPEQQENLQVLNRLKELAARQEAIAEKMKELEQQKQQAKTGEEKQEIDRQLKRLQEEQEQLLQDMDSLKERMEKPDNLANMTEPREKLEAAREEARKAAEQLAQDKAAQAAADATRAQRSLEEIRDEFREKTAKRFAEEMRSLKQQSQQLQTSQEKLAEALEQSATPSQDKPKDAADALEGALNAGKLARQVEQQKESLQKLLEEARKLSEAAESAEPLLSSTLYDAVRKAQSGGTEQALDTTRDLAMAGDTGRAQQQEQKAAKGVGELKEGIDRAAERVLGSDAEALRAARKEIDRLLKQVDPEGQSPAEEGNGDKNMAEKGEGQGEQESKTAQAGGDKPGKEAGKAPDEGEAGKEGEGMKPGGEAKGEQASSGAKGEGKGQMEGEGKEPGKGESEGKGEMAEAKGQGQGKGETPGSQGEGKNPGSEGKEGSQGEGQQGSQGQGQMAGNNPSERPGQNSQRLGPGQSKGGSASSSSGNQDGGDSARGGWFFDEPVAQADNNPITGEGYDRWSDGLRRVEEMLSTAELRDQAAKVREQARDLRLENKRNNAPPQADTVAIRITKPLIELRDRVTEALSRTESANPLAPLDRDPVPPRYREQVRRYYTELGGGK